MSKRVTLFIVRYLMFFAAILKEHVLSMVQSVHKAGTLHQLLPCRGSLKGTVLHCDQYVEYLTLNGRVQRNCLNFTLNQTFSTTVTEHVVSFRKTTLTQEQCLTRTGINATAAMALLTKTS